MWKLTMFIIESQKIFTEIFIREISIKWKNQFVGVRGLRSNQVYYGSD